MTQLPQRVYSSAQIRALEQEHAKTHGGNCYDLMEKAGRSAASAVMRLVPGVQRVWIFVGRGNNGGDGYVAAAALMEQGIEQRVFAVGLPHAGSEAQSAYEYYVSQGGKVEFTLPSAGELQPEAVIDALLGTGINAAPHSPVSEWIPFINNLENVLRLAVDVPSGVNADTGAVPGNCVNADVTLCMLGLKPGLFTGDAVDYVGRVEFESLGIDPAATKDALTAPLLPLRLCSYEDIVPELPLRLPSNNKGDAGKVLIVGGALGMGGAARICGEGALRAGAGLVKVALDPANISALNAGRPELMSVNSNDDEAVQDAIEWADVVAVGPGLSCSERAQELLAMCYAAKCYIVFDADALNLLSKQGSSFCERRIMTPHPGEAARLLGISIDDVNADRFQAAYDLQQRFGGVVLLKGAGTVICDGKTLTIVHEGSAAMASGGMGDLLTGMIAALSAQGIVPRLAAVIGACVHGRAGRLAGERDGMIGTLASDLSPFIRKLINHAEL